MCCGCCVGGQAGISGVFVYVAGSVCVGVFGVYGVFMHGRVEWCLGVLQVVSL